MSACSGHTVHICVDQASGGASDNLTSSLPNCLDLGSNGRLLGRHTSRNLGVDDKAPDDCGGHGRERLARRSASSTSAEGSLHRGVQQRAMLAVTPPGGLHGAAKEWIGTEPSKLQGLGLH